MDLEKRANGYAAASIAALFVATLLVVATTARSRLMVGVVLPASDGVGAWALLSISVACASAGCAGLVAAVCTRRTAEVWVALVFAFCLLGIYAPLALLQCYVAFG